MSESGIGSLRARGSSGATCVKYQERCRFSTLWNMRTEPFRISPVRGSCTCGPTAFSVVDGSQRTIVWRMSSGDQSGSFAGASPATMPSLKPAASNAGCHSSMPSRTHGFHHVRRRRVDVVRDRLLRVAEVAGAAVRALEAVLRDVAALRRALLRRCRSRPGGSRRSRRARRSGAASSAARGASRGSSARARLVRRARRRRRRRHRRRRPRRRPPPACRSASPRSRRCRGTRARARRTSASRRSCRGSRRSPGSPS